jgi:tubulin---tyrosine ligase
VNHRSPCIANPGHQSAAPSSAPKLYASIDYLDPYVQSLIISAMESQLPNVPFELISSIQQLPSPDSLLLQIKAYDFLDFDHAMSHPKSSLVCAYVIRKALIRKHYLSNTVSTWLVKRPDNVLGKHFRPAVHFELDYAEFLDEALVDAWDLNESMARNDEMGDEEKREWWILKPGMTDGGDGIRLFSSVQQLQGIFEGWEEEEEDDDEDKIDNMQDSGESKGHESVTANGVTPSQLRHFIAQPYIEKPLLLPDRGNRKFHIRVYVLAVGALKVYVYKEMLALFAARAYQAPSSLQDGMDVDLAAHLTNTCFQDEEAREGSVVRFWDLEDASLMPDWKERIFKQICGVTGEVFEAAAREQMVHFQPLHNAFEIFGVDFLVDEVCNVWLLELNAYPDFKQTGKQLQDAVIGGLFNEVVRTAIQPFFTNAVGANDDQGSGEMVLVRNVALGR